MSGANHDLIILLDEPDNDTALAIRKYLFLRTVTVKITSDIKELEKVCRIL